MKLWSIMRDAGMARSRREAETLVTQGAVSVGGCTDECPKVPCTCGQWSKIDDPLFEPAPGDPIKVKQGLWRTVPKLVGQGYDQLPGICITPIAVIVVNVTKHVT